jgi:ferritin-like metal-binding protein YciE
VTEALPKIARAASTEKLHDALTDHLAQTHGHVRRLEEIFGQLDMQVPSHRCKGMEGLVAESNEVVKADGDPAAKDAALIATAQRIEHYEIAGYGTARELARELGLSEVEKRLAATLDVESEADRRLSKIAAGGMLSTGVNKEAAVR